MILSRHLIRAVITPWLAISGGLATIFATYALTRALSDASPGDVSAGVIAATIALRTLIALEVLLPLGLFLGLIAGLGRLYADQEITIMQAAGLTRAGMARPLIVMALAAAVLTGLLSTVVRPWAYTQLYALEQNAQSELTLTKVTPGQFLVDDDSDIALYASHRKPGDARLNGVFAASHDHGRRVAIRAAAMTRQPAVRRQPPVLVFHNGHLYDIDPGSQDDRVIAFKQLKWQLSPPATALSYKRKAAGTTVLWHSQDDSDTAELEWRLSRPLATLCLALAGIALAASAPRRGRAANIIGATVLFVLYYNIAIIARSWVEQGRVDTLPGLFWVDALVAAITLVLWRYPRRTAY